MHMNWTRLKSYYGFSRPYNFDLILPIILRLFLIFLLALIFLGTYLSTHLQMGTAKFYSFLYLFLLLFIALLLSRLKRFSYLLTLWVIIEISLAIVSKVLSNHGYVFKVSPANQPIEVNARYVYHPLLMGIPKPNFRSKNSENKGVRVAHNSYGLRGKDLSVKDLDRVLVFVYGGSTAYDLGVSQGGTWPEELEKILGNKFTVVNFGVPGYSSVESIIQTAFYKNIFNKIPRCSIYLLGWNDIRNAHIENLDNAYADFHLLSQIDNLPVRKDIFFIEKISPIFKTLIGHLRNLVDPLPYPIAKGMLQSGSDSKLETIFSNNLGTIHSLNSPLNIKTVFVAQILNREQLIGERVQGWLPFVKDKDVWPLQYRFNEIMREKSKENGDLFVDVGIDNFTNDDFVDKGHFSEKGSKKFAKLVSDKLTGYCN